MQLRLCKHPNRQRRSPRSIDIHLHAYTTGTRPDRSKCSHTYVYKYLFRNLREPETRATNLIENRDIYVPPGEELFARARVPAGWWKMYIKDMYICLYHVYREMVGVYALQRR